jgi:hypothetical protein
MNPQIQDVADLEGTYLFDVRTSNRTLKLNRFFWSMIGADARARYTADPEQAMSAAGLTDEEKELVRRQDWIGLVRHGENFFVLEKFARVVRTTNLEVYAKMRGESFEQFMQTRQVPEAR